MPKRARLIDTLRAAIEKQAALCATAPRNADALARLDDRLLRDIGLERLAVDPAAPQWGQHPQALGACTTRSMIRRRR
ncbi:MAG: DUF1127 domain-containing protein [Alphaproteobacteria bacterium]|nr:DUF1127 domain-containing protein [Alphaproteobacteria bacterium]